MIYFVRHGQTDWNVEKKTQGHTDIPLNEKGREQALSLSKFTKNLKISRIISSDLIRAKETAAILNNEIVAPLELDKRLREFNYGDIEGIPRDELDPKVWDIFNNSPEQINAEPLANVYARVKDILSSIENEKENILIVAHGGTLRVIMHYAEQKEKFDKELYDATYKNYKIKNGAIYKWSSAAGKICSVNLDEQQEFLNQKIVDSKCR